MKVPVIFTCFLLLAWGFMTNVRANTGTHFYEVKRFLEQQKLSNRNINDIAQDTTGFLWIATSNGLNKYDGSKVSAYLFNPEDSTSIADNYIQRLFVDSDGILWVLVPRFFCRYDEEKDCFIRYEYTNVNKNTHTSNPGEITEDNRGNIWIGTPELGLYSFNKKTERIKNHHIMTDLNISELVFDGQETLWVGSVGNVFTYNINTNQHHTIKLPKFESVVRINLNRKYILTRSACYYMDNQDLRHVKLRLTNNLTPYKDVEVLSMLETDYFYWFGTKGKGLIVHSKKKETTQNSRYQENNPNTISNNTVGCLFEDRFGVVWIGTGDGLNKCNPYLNLFSLYLHEEKENSLISNIVTGFCEDDDQNIWIITYEGVSCFNPKTNHFTNYSSVPVNGEMMNFKNIRYACKDKNGNLWFCHKEGLFKLDYRKKTFSFHPLLFNDHSGTDLLCARINQNYIWVGTYGYGAFQVDCETGLVVNVLNTKNSKLSSDFIKDIVVLSDGRMCFATLRTGIDVFDADLSGFTNVNFTAHTHNYVSDYINNVFQDSKKNIWVLSWHGAFVLNEDLELKFQFTIEEGIAANEVTSISEDINGDIWLGTTNGVSRISSLSTGNYHVSNYTVEDGLTSNSISTGSIFVSSDHTIYLGTSNGFNAFRVEDVPINTTSIAPTITGLSIFNKPVRPDAKINGQVVLDKQINLKREIRLNYKQEIISLYFSSLDFSQDKKFRYAYMLEGLDKDWVYTENEANSANYSNLRPGKYTFRVKSENSNGIWSPDTTLDIIVTPPWWATWWAYCIYLALFIAALYITIKIFVYQEKLRQNLRIEKIQHEKENEINDIKIRFYTNISHDIRTPLTLIIGPLEYILKHETLTDWLKEQLDVIHNNASYLLTLINQLLDFRKVETEKGALKASEHDIVQFVKEITYAFESYALQKKIDLKFESETKEEMLWFDPQLISKVLYNIISNAIKFTFENGTITIHISSSEKEVRIKVIDTGIGINPEEQEKIFHDFYQVHHNNGSMLDSYTSGSGIGLSIVKKYVEIHHGRVSVDSKPGKGTTFTIALKKGAGHFEESQIDYQKNALPKVQLPYFQIYKTDVKNAEEAETENNPEGNSILVVDDNPDIIKFISNCLHDSFIVFTANNGKQGLEIAERELPDVIISDIMMPEMDGIDFVKNLKNNELTQHIPVLFLTAKSSFEDTVKGLELGAIDYITKPFNESFLFAKVKNLIQDRNLLADKLKKKYLSDSPDSEQEKPEGNGRKNEFEEITDPFMLKVIQYVKMNLENPDLSSDSIEKHFHVSKVQLYRKLKVVSGLSAVDIIRNLRINKASELLIHSDMNVSEIAYNLGFSDPFYFSKTFKKETGLSPLQYRREKQNNGSVQK